MSESLRLPPALAGIFFDVRWDKQKVWRLNTPTTRMSITALVWHLDLPIWSTVPPQPSFDLTPRQVIEQPSTYAYHWQRIWATDLAFPLELFPNQDRLVILDGYHRLAQHYLRGTDSVPVRQHSAEFLTLIRSTS